MKQYHFILFILLLCTQFGYSQNISIYKTFGGYRFERDSISISPKMVQEQMKINPAAYSEFKSARNNLGVSSALKFVGGLLIIVPLTTAIGGGDPEWVLAAGGLGLLLASIPLDVTFRNRALNSLDIYNAQPKARQIKTNLHFSGLGAKFVIRF